MFLDLPSATVPGTLPLLDANVAYGLAPLHDQALHHSLDHPTLSLNCGFDYLHDLALGLFLWPPWAVIPALTSAPVAASKDDVPASDQSAINGGLVRGHAATSISCIPSRSRRLIRSNDKDRDQPGSNRVSASFVVTRSAPEALPRIPVRCK